VSGNVEVPDSDLGNLSISLGQGGLGVLGLTSVAIVLGGALIAAIPYRGYAFESYSPLNHFISELGEVSASRFAWAYNLGVVVGGLGLGAFLLMVSRAMSGRFRTAFVAISAVAGTAGPLCGLFPMDYLSTHRLVSGAFFLSGGLLAATFTAWLIRTKPPEFPRPLAIPGLAAVGVFMAFFAVYSTYRPLDPNAHLLVRSDVWTVPLLEWASLLSLLLWLACLSASLLRRRTD
jgi:hypothetical membrane protein